MTRTAPARRPSHAARRVGYLIAAAINAALIYAIHVWPGWQVVPFLTDDTEQVLGLVTLSLVAGVIANIIYIGYDPPWVKALGDLVTTGFGLAALVRMLQVFPFDFSGWSFDAGLLARILLIVGIAGAGIGMVVQFLTLLSRLFRHSPQTQG